MDQDYFGKAVVANLPFLLEGFRLSVGIAIVALGFSLAVGTVVALLRVAPFGVLRAVGTTYVEFIRNVPLIIQLFYYYYALPSVGIRLDAFAAGVLGLGVYTSAFVGEALRAGILSVGKGQVEAARCLGLGYGLTMRHIILPQAFTVSLPPLANVFIDLIKSSAILSTIAVAELMYNAETLEAHTFRTFEIFTAVAALYLLLIMPLSALVNGMERKLSRSR